MQRPTHHCSFLQKREDLRKNHTSQYVQRSSSIPTYFPKLYTSIPWNFYSWFKIFRDTYIWKSQTYKIRTSSKTRNDSKSFSINKRNKFYTKFLISQMTQFKTTNADSLFKWTIFLVINGQLFLVIQIFPCFFFIFCTFYTSIVDLTSLISSLIVLTMVH